MKRYQVRILPEAEEQLIAMASPATRVHQVRPTTRYLGLLQQPAPRGRGQRRPLRVDARGLLSDMVRTQKREPVARVAVSCVGGRGRLIGLLGNYRQMNRPPPVGLGASKVPACI